MRRSVWLFLCTVLIAALMMTGCAPSNSPGETPAAAGENRHSADDSLVFALNADPLSLDQIATTDQCSCIVWYNMCNNLFELKLDGSIENSLATGYEWSDDYLQLTVTLRDDVLFHNGEPFTSDDVVYTFERAKTSPQTAGNIGALDYVEAVDDYTVIFHWKSVFMPALNVLSNIQYSIVNREAVEAAGDDYPLHPIGTGPYMFVERVSGEKIVMKAFDEYFEGPPTIKNLTFRIITDSSTAVVALETGEIDCMSHVPLSAKDTIVNNPNLEWYSESSSGNVMVIFNNGPDSRFSNQKLREAVCYAVDRESLILGCVEGEGTPAALMSTPWTFGYTDEVTYFERDIEKAKALMAEAGYPDGLTVKCKTFESATYSQVVEILQSQLAEIGITIEIEKQEKAAYLTDIISNHDFEMTTIYWGDLYRDSDWVYDLTHSTQIKTGKNFSEISDPNLDKALDDARTSIDPERRKELYKEAYTIMRDNSYICPLFSYNIVFAANADLQGAEASYYYIHHVYNYSWK